MKVLYASTLYPPSVGGTQIHLHRLARAVQARGHGVRVATHSGRDRRDWLRLATVCCEAPLDYEHEGVPVRRLGFSWGTRLRMLPWAIGYYAMIGTAGARLARRMEPYVQEAAGAPDMVHATRAGREFLARAALAVARRRGVPFCLTPNHHARWRGRLYRGWDALYREADAVFALTDVERETLIAEKGVAAERIHVTGVGPVLPERCSEVPFRRRYGLEAPYVLFIGRQVAPKGIGAIRAAAERVWRERPDVRFVFIGPETPYSRGLFRLTPDRRVMNLGRVDLQTKGDALAGCALLCMPSTQESFGGAYVEAWALGKPVIAAPVPAVASLVRDGENGLLAEPRAEPLARALLYLLSHPDEAAAMGEAGRRLVEARYTWDRIAEMTLDVYGRLTA